VVIFGIGILLVSRRVHRAFTVGSEPRPRNRHAAGIFLRPGG